MHREPPARTDAAALVQRLLDPACPPFALLRRRTPGRDAADTIEVLTGEVTEVERLADIPLGDGTPDAPVTDALALIPFRQIRERGFRAHDDGTPLAVLRPRETAELPLDEMLAALPAHDVRVTDGAFDVDDDAYAGIVGRVVRDEIGTGEGANFVIRRTFEGEIADFSAADALALFRRLLAGERGAYWTYVVHRPGVRTLVGASPEVHVRMTGERGEREALSAVGGGGRRVGGTVVMNPISGTYRYPEGGPTAESLLTFLDDRKEVEELSMVVDEELKMMCTVGDKGGVVIGPRLKEMAHLAHTEYELRGRSTLDVREVLKETMFAATVTGSPVQNACRVIERHEPADRDGRGRGYYAGALALIGRDAGGAQTLDSPILIRTADISAGGRLRVPVGATLVRASDPHSEVAETHAKAAGVLSALGVRPAPARPGAGGRPPRLADDPRVRAALDARRADLAPFWLRMQTTAPTAELSGHALVIDAEDTFTAMLAHLLRTSGLTVTVRRFDEPGLREAARAHRGPVVLGPGPGDPSDAADPKMRFLRSLTAELVAGHRHGPARLPTTTPHRGPSGRAILGVCLGHELIAAELGLEIVRKEVPFQGAQERIEFFGRTETVGFYNTFTARCDDTTAAELAMHRVELSRDPASGEVHALRGPGFAGVQFHPESVLTLDGASVTAQLLAAVLV
ncbi:anthranilate synthase family protein [Streptomyces sp. Je 1-4]|uniref:anthranilate synthase family protein n=1 Tax=Streptomyces TaxID=1883 RepID=UPI0021D824AC|nr:MULTISPECIES: anthranilate synthase family protein [unclassified Streptomyces]UYB42893.1 anthranilate synthase family protein [Streptomyces sp. Je 1-4]UZQ39229.1 anthranilate synthase family protein [Streptomyces sp. Je 1-4] [Streptomyces sp. Je 1-4 4N24]UZQ46646.1 anthranilate synthase family protein [Streptomyces sp. Je 1-4] [Streptomyces sp. Je 1-4 4N24_ara]